MGQIKHGFAVRGKKNPTYESWEAMRARCNNPNCEKFPTYGGKGIIVCKRWDSYSDFLADMGERLEGMTIDRIDNEGNYEPSNCKWSTRSEQQLNKGIRKDNKSGCKGVTQIKGSWIARGTKNKIVYQLYCGQSFEEAVRCRKAWEVANGITQYE